MQGYYPGQVNQNAPPCDNGFENVNYNNYPYQNEQPNPQYIPNQNMNYNYNPNNFHPNRNPQMNIQPYVYPNQNKMPPNIVGNPNCAYCRGTGIIFKKNKSKPCKHCRNVNPFKHRTWCCCLKIDKKGYKKCKINKHSCEIL